MSDQFKSLMLSTRDEFEYWLFHFHDVLTEFRSFFQEETGHSLDYSSDSLDLLEDWLLKKYSDHETILKFGNKEILDGASR